MDGDADHTGQDNNHPGVPMCLPATSAQQHGAMPSRCGLILVRLRIRTL